MIIAYVFNVEWRFCRRHMHNSTGVFRHNCATRVFPPTDVFSVENNFFEAWGIFNSNPFLDIFSLFGIKWNWLYLPVSPCPEKQNASANWWPSNCLYVLLADYINLNTLRPRQNGRHLADDTFKRIFVNENVIILIAISQKFAPKGPINNIPPLVQIMAWRRPGAKPLFEPMLICLPTHICVTRLNELKMSA